MSNPDNITCTCGYSWCTRSLLLYVSCPNCGRKTYNPQGQTALNIKEVKNDE